MKPKSRKRPACGSAFAMKVVLTAFSVAVGCTCPDYRSTLFEAVMADTAGAHGVRVVVSLYEPRNRGDVGINVNVYAQGAKEPQADLYHITRIVLLAGSGDTIFVGPLSAGMEPHSILVAVLYTNNNGVHHDRAMQLRDDYLAGKGSIIVESGLPTQQFVAGIPRPSVVRDWQAGSCSPPT